MYFVTTKCPGYILFSMTPSERGAMGLTEHQEVHVLQRENISAPWQIIAKWNVAEFSHTEFMAAWHHRPEPSRIEGLLDVLPPNLSGTATASV